MASVNFKKIKHGSGSAWAIMRHCDKGERQKHDHANEDIDKTLTHENQQMHRTVADAMYQYEQIMRRVDQTNRNHRSDRVDMFILESAAPVGMDPAEFSEIMYRAVADQYGRENIVTWYLHKDEIHEYMDHGQVVESRSHVHMFVVPEHDGQLNGKWFSSRANMKALNHEIDDRCHDLGFEYLTYAEPRNRSVEELKLDSYKESIEATENAKIEADRAESELLCLQAENLALKAKNEALTQKNNELEIRVDRLDRAISEARSEVEKIEPRQGLFQKEPYVKMPARTWAAVESRAVLNRELGTLALRDEALRMKSMADEYSDVKHREADRALADARSQSRALIADAKTKAHTLEQLNAEIQIDRIRERHPEYFDDQGRYIEDLDNRTLHRSVRSTRDFDDFERF